MPRSGGSAGRLPARELQESACRLTECHHPEIVGAFVAVAVTILAVVLAGAALSRLDDARAAISAERERAHEELEAFEAFVRRVRSLEPTAPTGGPMSDGGVPLADRTGGPDELALVRRAYRETVMAVPHHESEFGETLREGMAAEFSPEVAAAVAAGGRLTPGLHTALIRRGVSAIDRRKRILTDLDEEQTAVETASDTLSPAVETADAVESRAAAADAGELVAEADRIGYHERQVERLASDRQTTVHEVEADRAAWYEYIYGELPSPHPVLSASTATLVRLERARDAVAAALAAQTSD